MTAKTALTRSAPAKTSRNPPGTGKNVTHPSGFPVTWIRAPAGGLEVFGMQEKKRAAGNMST